MRHKAVLYNLMLFLLMLGFTTCIDPYVIVSPDEKEFVTIEGLIGTTKRAYEVRITLANQFTNTIRGNIIPVHDAIVTIEDDLGNMYPLQEKVLYERVYCTLRNGWISRPETIKTGRYYTQPDFQAKIERKYKLEVVLKNGKSYQSKIQEIIPTPEIDSISMRPFSTPTINPLIQNTGIELFAHFRDDPTKDNYYLWKPANAIYALKTQPELYSLPPDDPNCPRCPSPKACCNTCFTEDYEIESAFSIESDFLFNGLDALASIHKINDDGRRFGERYRLEIKQYAISEEAYKFFKLIEQQLQLSGSVFDPLPATIKGNMERQNDENEIVLGYFLAVDEKSKVIYVNRSDLPIEYRKPSAIIPDDCRTFCETPVPIDIFPPADWVF